MAIKIRDKIIENSQKFLKPNEKVQAVIPGQTLNQYWAVTILAGVLPYLILILVANRYRATVVTDQRILVLDTGKWSQGTPKSVVRELPRNVRIGPAKGLWWKSSTLGETIYINKRFHSDVTAADAALPA